MPSDHTPRQVKHLNTRFLSGLLIVCAISALGLYFLHDFQVDRSAGLLLTRSDQALAEGDANKSMELLGQYLKFRPEDTESLAKLADLVDREEPTSNTINRSIRIYSQVLRDAPGIEGAPRLRYRLVQLMIRLGQFQPAESQIARLHTILDESLEDSAESAAEADRLPFDRSQLFHLQGLCQRGQSRSSREMTLVPELALAYYLAAIGADPARLDPYIDSINVALRLGRELPTRDQLERRLAQRSGPDPLAAIPEDLLALLPRTPTRQDDDDQEVDSATKLSETGDETAGSTATVDLTRSTAQDLIDKLLERMLQHGEPKFEARLGRAQYYLQRGELSQVETEVEEARKLAEHEPAFQLFLTYYHRSLAENNSIERNPDAAREHVATAIEIATRGRETAESAVESAESDADRADAFSRSIQFSVALSEAQTQRFGLEPSEEPRRIALDTSQQTLEDAIAVLPQARDSVLQIPDREQRDQELNLLNQFSVALPERLVEVKLQAMESGLLTAEKFNQAAESAAATIAELTDRLADRGRVMFLKAHWCYVHLAADRSIPQSRPLRDVTAEGTSWGNVTQQLRNARALLSDNIRYRRQIDLKLASCYRSLQNPEARLLLFRDVARIDPGWLPGRFQYALALEELGRLDEALQQYAFLQRERGFEPAIVAMLRIAISKQLELDSGQQNWSRIQANLNELLAQRPDNPAYQLMQIELDAQQKKYQDVEDGLKRLVSREDATPQELLTAWRTTIMFSLNRDDLLPAEQINLADQARQNALEALGPKGMLAAADLAVAQRVSRDALAKKAEQIEQSVEDYPAEEQIPILTQLAAAYEQLEDTPARTRILSQLSQLRPEQSYFHQLLANAAIDFQDEAAFRRHLAEVRRIEGASSATGNFLEARWVEDQMRQAHAKSDLSDEEVAQVRQWYTQARKLLRDAEQVRPEWIQIFLLRGDLARSPRIDDELAMYEAYRRAIELGTDNPEVYRFVTAYLKKENRQAEANQLLTRLQREKPFIYTTQLQLAHSQIQFEQGNYEEYFSLARSAQTGAEPYATHLNEAFLKLLELQLEELRNPDSPKIAELREQIEGEFEAAIEAAPEQARVWVGYVIYHRDRGDRDAAVQVIQRAKELFPDGSGEIKSLTLGACYELVGDNEQAREHYDQALQVQPKSPAVHKQLAEFSRRTGDPKQERFHLEKHNELIDSDSEIWHSNQYRLQSLDAQMGTYRDAEQAIAKLQETLPWQKELRIRNLTTQVDILTRYSVRPFQLKLIAVLEEMKQLDALPLTDQITLLALYRQTRQRDRALQAARELHEKHLADQLILSLYTELCLQEKQYEEAEKLLPLFEPALPGLAVFLRSRLDFDQGLKQQAIDRIIEYRETIQPTQPSDRIFRETIARTNYHLVFRWLYDVPGIRGTIQERRVNEGLRQLNLRNLTEAHRELKPVLDLPEVQRAAYAQRLRECFVHLTNYEALPEAERICRDYLEVVESPEDVVLLISLIGQQGDVQRTLDLCEASLEQAGATRVIPNTIALLRQNPHTPEQDARVARMISDNVAANPNDLSALLQSADYQDFKQNYDAAERTYALVLSKNGNSPLALNNLAWLLAMHKPTPERIKQARQLIDRAIDRVGPSAELMDSKATVELASGNADKAIELLENSIQTLPTAAKNFHLAQAYFQAGKKAEAREKLQRAISDGLYDEYLHPLESPLLEQLRKDLTTGS